MRVSIGVFKGPYPTYNSVDYTLQKSERSCITIVDSNLSRRRNLLLEYQNSNFRLLNHRFMCDLIFRSISD